VRKVVWNLTTLNSQLSTQTHFVYDGWNVRGDLDAVGRLVQSYVWGLDLCGLFQGAGGVGGLLWVHTHEQGAVTAHFATFDGNGNVMSLVNGEDGTESARYEYGPFGELLRATGPLSQSNPFRFSTKYQDHETGLVYYGFRYYDPEAGRWLSRDPIGESITRNLY
jgi:RHS repeat-associated protein